MELLEEIKQDLNSLIAHSHSWIITEETGRVLSQVHGEYRDKIKALIRKIETGNVPDEK